MSIIPLEIPGSVFLSSVNNHHLIKQDILKSIERMGRFSVETESQKIYNTDFFTPQEYDRPYITAIARYLEEHNKKLYEFLGLTANGIKIDRCWFQQYKKDDWHGVHAHGNCNFSNVYYVDLDEKNPSTTFTFMNKQFTISVKEGDILTFPGYLEHESLPNQSEHIKTIISFNSNIL